MQLSDHGEAVIKNFEGLRLQAYRDSAGVWTIGYGSTRYHDGKMIRPGDKLANEEQAAALFRNTLGKYEASVKSLIKVPLSQNQFDALCSFAYNEGTGALQESTLLRKLNEGDYQEAADQFLIWNKITDPKNGEKIVLKVLVKRRQQERQLFLMADNKNSKQ